MEPYPLVHSNLYRKFTCTRLNNLYIQTISYLIVGMQLLLRHRNVPPDLLSHLFEPPDFPITVYRTEGHNSFSTIIRRHFERNVKSLCISTSARPRFYEYVNLFSLSVYLICPIKACALICSSNTYKTPLVFIATIYLICLLTISIIEILNYYSSVVEKNWFKELNNRIILRNLICIR